MADDTSVPGIGRKGGTVELGVTTQHGVNHLIRSEPRRPGRCLRHHVWMAACDECRDVRAALVAGERDGRTPAH